MPKKKITKSQTWFEVLYRLRDCTTPASAVGSATLSSVCNPNEEGTPPSSALLQTYLRKLYTDKLLGREPDTFGYRYYITPAGQAAIESSLESLARRYPDRAFPDTKGKWLSDFTRQPRPDTKHVTPWALPSDTLPMGSLMWHIVHFFNLGSALHKHLRLLGQYIEINADGSASLCSLKEKEEELDVNEVSHA